jgi:hypothetical protein
MYNPRMARVEFKIPDQDLIDTKMELLQSDGWHSDLSALIRSLLARWREDQKKAREDKW